MDFEIIAPGAGMLFVILGFLASTGYSIKIAIKLIRARAKKQYALSNLENHIYIYSCLLGGLLFIIPALLGCFAVGGLLGGGWGSGISETYFPNNKVAYSLSTFIGLYAGMTIWVVSVMAIGTYLASIIGELLIFIIRKRKTV